MLSVHHCSLSLQRCSVPSLQSVPVSEVLLSELGRVTGQAVVSLGGSRHLLVESKMLHSHLKHGQSQGDRQGWVGSDQTNNLPSWWTGGWADFIGHN